MIFGRHKHSFSLPHRVDGKDMETCWECGKTRPSKIQFAQSWMAVERGDYDRIALGSLRHENAHVHARNQALAARHDRLIWITYISVVLLLTAVAYILWGRS